MIMMRTTCRCRLGRLYPFNWSIIDQTEMIVATINITGVAGCQYLQLSWSTVLSLTDQRTDTAHYQQRFRKEVTRSGASRASNRKRCIRASWILWCFQTWRRRKGWERHGGYVFERPE